MYKERPGLWAGRAFQAHLGQFVPGQKEKVETSRSRHPHLSYLLVKNN